jgi:radical SAM protein with 4Fe4S-binding SPASM domain
MPILNIMIKKNHPLKKYDSSTNNFEFSKKEIDKAVSHDRLLSMEIELSLHCNFKCPYCYVPHTEELQNELTPDEIENVILQAKTLGAQKIIILGGEPSIYPQLIDIINFIVGQNLEVEMFSNGTGITAEFAKRLFEKKVRVVMKMNTFDEALQNKLSGHPNAYEIIKSAFNNLKQAGYPSDDHFLAASSIICRQNIAELPYLWQWLRNRQIVPYFEIITPQANARLKDWLYVTPMKLKALFEEIAEIDRHMFGRSWSIQPPLVGNKCMRHQFSCLITAKGDVYPCVGISLSMGNIRKQPLADILSESRIIKDLKNFKKTIKGSCRMCEKADECYGCRGAAFQITGDYLASDPLCWHTPNTL